MENPIEFSLPGQICALIASYLLTKQGHVTKYGQRIRLPDNARLLLVVAGRPIMICEVAITVLSTRLEISLVWNSPRRQA
jgi:hypothetical protein